MTIIALINRELGIRVHHAVGRVTPAEFSRSFEYYATHPTDARTDLITMIDEAVDVSCFAMKDLTALRSAFRELYVGPQVAVVLRSAWVCPSVSAWPLIEEWLRDRHSRDGMATEVCLVTRLEEADCMYDADELAAVRSLKGFAPLHTFTG